MNKYRLLLRALDEVGITAAIVRAGPKWYEVHVNFEIVKRYRQRRSANTYISRLHASKIPSNPDHGIDPTEDQQEDR